MGIWRRRLGGGGRVAAMKEAVGGPSSSDVVVRGAASIIPIEAELPLWRCEMAAALCGSS